MQGFPQAEEDSAGRCRRHTWPCRQRHPPHIQAPWHALSPTPCHHVHLTLLLRAAAGAARICRPLARRVSGRQRGCCAALREKLRSQGREVGVAVSEGGGPQSRPTRAPSRTAPGPIQRSRGFCLMEKIWGDEVHLGSCGDLSPKPARAYCLREEITNRLLTQNMNSFPRFQKC